MKKIEFGTKPSANITTHEADAWVTDRAAAEPTKRLTLDVPLSLHTRVKVGCAKQDLRIADVVRELLDEKFKYE